MASDTHRMGRVIIGMYPMGRSENALNVGLDLAQRFGAAVEIVHGVRPPHHLWPDLTPHDVDTARAAITTRLEGSLAGACLETGKPPHELVVESTKHPAQLLLDRARNPQADLVVLGRHRRRGLFDFGSTLSAVLSEASCPVWVQAGPVRVVRNILVPVDLSDESLGALRHACAWARALEARLHVVHCFQQPELLADAGHPVAGPTYVIDRLREDAEKEFRAVIEGFDFQGAEVTSEFVEEEPASCILEHQDDVDLVMMGSHGRTGLSAALLGNVTMSVLRSGHVPVVVMRHPEREWVL